MCTAIADSHSGHAAYSNYNAANGDAPMEGAAIAPASRLAPANSRAAESKYPVYSTHPKTGTGSNQGQGGLQFILIVAAVGGGCWAYTKAQETGEKIVERLPYQVIPNAELGAAPAPAASAGEDLEF
jgi:hypothetical protein